MSKGKYRITYTTEVANDQGGVIPNNVIDYSRYLLNPVVLRDHQWSAYSIAMMTDIDEKDPLGHSGIPDFHGVTEDSQISEKLYNKGYLRSASIGGEAIWAKDKLGNDIKDKDGNRVCEKFILYEISLPTLPSNPTAVSQLSAINDEELQAEVEKGYTNLKAKIYNSTEIIKLCSKYSEMSEQKNKEQLTLEAKAAKEKANSAAKEEETAEKLVLEAENLHVEEDKSSHVVLQAMKIMGDTFKSIFAGTNKVPIQNEEGGTDPIVTTTPGKEIVDDKIGETNQLAAKKEAEEKAEKARANYEQSLEKVKMCKESADGEKDETEKAKKIKAYEKAKEEAESAKKEAESAKDAIEKQKKSETEEEKTKNKTENKKETFSAKMEIQKKTMEELAAEHVKLAADTSVADGIKFTARANVPTFTELCSKGNKEGNELLARVQAKDSQKDLRDYAVVLNSIMQDPRYSAIVEKTRFHMCNSDAQVNHLRDNSGQRMGGYSLGDIAARLNSGYVEGTNFKAGSRSERMTKLSTDGSFSSLDTVAVEWLPLVIFRLVPSNSWKANIPMIASNETVRNTGVIWTNIASRPNIYRGTSPNPSVNYNTGDTAVGVKLVPYWMESMLWKPLDMHQLRYDQMSSQWAQALADFEAYQSDDQLYTLLAGLIANQPNNMIYTNGPQITAVGGQTPSTFQILSANSPDSFVLNPNFVTAQNQSLVRPGLNDIISGEQIFNKQNYDLSNRKVSLVVDPTMEKYLKNDPESKSLLTRWITDDGKDITRFSHTDLFSRSRVALFDPATGTAIDTHADGVIIPTTALSAGVGFVTNDVAIAIGMLDVFAVQDPNNYAYKLSANIRTGIRALRSDYTGVYGYTYTPQP